jgi:serine/threonine protein kinase
MLLLHAGRQHAQHAQHDRRKHRGVQAAHDVWSLGCTLYELLTGSVLFEDEVGCRVICCCLRQCSVVPWRVALIGMQVGLLVQTLTQTCVYTVVALCVVLQGVGRITSYSSSQSSGGGAHSLRPDARGWGVLNAREKAALAHHRGCIELVESMLVGEPNWRPTAEQVVVKTQRLLGAVLSSS